MKRIALSGSSLAAQPVLSILRAAGLDVTDQPAATAGIETLFLLPRDIMESEQLLFEVEALAKTLPDLTAIAIIGTLSPRYVRALRARISKKIALVDAPFIGSPRMMQAGGCAFLLGGPDEALDELQPIFDLLSPSAVRMGGFGTASSAKALQDCLSAASSAMTRSALDWAEAQGIDESHVMSLLEQTFGARLSRKVSDPSTFVANALPGDNAGALLVKNVETALDKALKGVHLTPPRNFEAEFSTVRARHVH